MIDALGKKEAAKVKQQALVDVAAQEKAGAIGVTMQAKEQEISVGISNKDRIIGVRKAEQETRMRLEQMEAEEMMEVNLAKQKKIESDSALAVSEASFAREAQIAQKEADAAIAEANARAQTRAALVFAEQVEAETRAQLEAKAENAKPGRTPFQSQPKPKRLAGRPWLLRKQEAKLMA